MTSEASWDSPPLPTEPTYPAFKTALERFIAGREVQIPKVTKERLEILKKRSRTDFKQNHILRKASDLDIGQNEKMELLPFQVRCLVSISARPMPLFQVDGFNWLCNNWWTNQHCILADEMGLVRRFLLRYSLATLFSSGQNRPDRDVHR